MVESKREVEALGGEMAGQPRILVVDDDSNITSFLKRALTYEGYLVETAASGPAGLAAARDVQPDVIVLDVMLPGLDGLAVCRRLRASSDVPILMLTAKDEVSDRVKGLDCGADDYLVKPFALEELLARLRVIMRRREPETPTVLSYADLMLDTATREARRGDRVIELTTKEYELLAFFLRHPRQVLTREVILQRVWGFDFEGETHVLEVYVGYLRQKLEAGGESRLIHTVRHAGYVLKE
jgi:two-component system response regulator MprA